MYYFYIINWKMESQTYFTSLINYHSRTHTLGDKNVTGHDLHKIHICAAKDLGRNLLCVHGTDSHWVTDPLIFFSFLVLEIDVFLHVHCPRIFLKNTLPLKMSFQMYVLSIIQHKSRFSKWVKQKLNITMKWNEIVFETLKGISRSLTKTIKYIQNEQTPFRN